MTKLGKNWMFWQSFKVANEIKIKQIYYYGISMLDINVTKAPHVYSLNPSSRIIMNL